MGCVVTIAASGSEGSTDSVVTLVTEDGHQYKRCADGDILRPLFAIMNPELMMTLPPYQTASGWPISSPTAWSAISPIPRTAS